MYPPLLAGGAKATIPYAVSGIRICNSEWNEDCLQKSIASLDFDRLSIVAIFCDFRKDVPLVVGVVIVAVDNPHGVVELQAMLEPKATTRQASKPPAVLHVNTNAGWDFQRTATIQREGKRCSEVVTGTCPPSLFPCPKADQALNPLLEF